MIKPPLKWLFDTNNHDFIRERLFSHKALISTLLNSILLPEEDLRFYKKGWTFPHRSQFVRGCIKIEPKITQ